MLLLDNEKRTYFCLIGAYANLDKEAKDKARRKGLRSQHKLDSVIDDMIQERKGDDKIKDLFHRLDLNGDGFLDKNEFILAYKRLNPDVCAAQLEAMFEEADVDDSGTLDLKEVRCPSVDDGTRQIRLTFLQFMAMVKLPQVDVLGKLSGQSRQPWPRSSEPFKRALLRRRTPVPSSQWSRRLPPVRESAPCNGVVRVSCGVHAALCRNVRDVPPNGHARTVLLSQDIIWTVGLSDGSNP